MRGDVTKETSCSDASRGPKSLGKSGFFPTELKPTRAKEVLKPRSDGLGLGEKVEASAEGALRHIIKGGGELDEGAGVMVAPVLLRSIVRAACPLELGDEPYEGLPPYVLELESGEGAFAVCAERDVVTLKGRGGLDVPEVMVHYYQAVLHEVLGVSWIIREGGL